MIKVVHIIPSLGMGGAERFVVDLCNSLSEFSDVYLISLYDNDDKSFVKYVSPSVQYISLGKKPGFDFICMKKLYSVLKRIKPNIVNTHINALEYYVPYMAVNSKNVRSFHTIHSKADKESANSFIFKFRKFLYKKKKVIPVTIAKTMSDSFKESYGLLGYDKQIDNGRPYVKPNKETAECIREKFLKDKNGFVFVNVARIVPEKNQLNLVKAFKEISEEYKQSVLLILGEEKDEEISKAIKIEINNMDNKRIFMLGGISNVEDYLAASDVFVLPSIYEGMPISLIEAMSHCCIPLCSPVGGIFDMIVDGKNGLLTEGTDVNALKDGFIRFFALEEKTEMKENSYKNFIENYDIKSTAKNYYELYESSFK